MTDFPAMHQYSSTLASALSSVSFLKTRPCRYLNLLTQPLDALKLSVFSWAAIIFAFPSSVVPSVWFQFYECRLLTSFSLLARVTTFLCLFTDLVVLGEYRV
jgi:uncharacterized membrane protein